MAIEPLNRVNLVAPVDPAPTLQDDPAITRQIVTVVRALNKSEFLGPNRQLTYARDPKTQQPVIRVIERETGDVVDQLPAEAILRLRQQLEPQQHTGESYI